MKEKIKNNIRELFTQIECIDKKMKNVNEELDYIHKLSQKLIFDVKEIIKNGNKPK